MIIHKIELTNFRQFQGHQVIEFCDGAKNVTVIYGENGRGKTGLFRALVFCLYGDTALTQDEGGSSNNLVNEPLVRGNRGNAVTAKVEVVFSHDSVKYRLSREVHGMLLDSGEVGNELGKVALVLTEADGRDVIVPKEEINARVSRVLNKKVRDYFLFDGERIEKLTKHGKSQAEDVKKGIRAILSLDDVDVAVEGLKRVKKDLDTEIIAKTPSTKLKQLGIERLSKCPLCQGGVRQIQSPV